MGDHVKTLRSRVEKLEAEVEGARQGAEMPPQQAASQANYTAVSDHVARAIQALDDEVERQRAQANEEIERMLSEARADADRIRQDAESRADEVRRLAEGALEEARRAADAIQCDAQETAEETLATADALLSEARKESGLVLADLKRRRRSLFNVLQRTRNAVDQALSDLDPAIHEEGPADESSLRRTTVPRNASTDSKPSGIGPGGPEVAP